MRLRKRMKLIRRYGLNGLLRTSMPIMQTSTHSSLTGQNSLQSPYHSTMQILPQEPWMFFRIARTLAQEYFNLVNQKPEPVNLVDRRLSGGQSNAWIPIPPMMQIPGPFRAHFIQSTILSLEGSISTIQAFSGVKLRSIGHQLKVFRQMHPFLLSNRNSIHILRWRVQ